MEDGSIVDLGGAETGKIHMIAVGDQHVAALTQEGRVYTWGVNNALQLGYAGGNSSYAKVVTVKENDKDVKFVSVAAGINHTLALTETREV